jgi:predicted XRE-type DNA-binding protein
MHENEASSILKSLVGVLKQEAAIYEELLAMSKDKTHVIVKGKIQELEQIVKSEQDYILKLSELENERETFVDRLSAIKGTKAEELTISAITQMFAGKEAEELFIVQQKLMETIQSLSETNELNEKLIQSSLDYINFTISLITTAGDDDNSYDTNASLKAPKSKSLLDMKI